MGILAKVGTIVLILGFFFLVFLPAEYYSSPTYYGGWDGNQSYFPQTAQTFLEENYNWFLLISGILLIIAGPALMALDTFVIGKKLDEAKAL
jgi:hypothetical protein